MSAYKLVSSHCIQKSWLLAIEEDLSMSRCNYYHLDDGNYTEMLIVLKGNKGSEWFTELIQVGPYLKTEFTLLSCEKRRNLFLEEDLSPLNIVMYIL